MATRRGRHGEKELGSYLLGGIILGVDVGLIAFIFISYKHEGESG